MRIETSVMSIKISIASKHAMPEMFELTLPLTWLMPDAIRDFAIVRDIVFRQTMFYQAEKFKDKISEQIVKIFISKLIPSFAPLKHFYPSPASRQYT